MIKLRGRVIENNKGVKILVIHNKKISEKITNNNKKVSIKNYKDGFLLEPSGRIHVTINSGKTLQIAITRLIRDKEIEIKYLGDIDIYVDIKKWGINENEMFGKSIGSPFSSSIPKNLETKNAAIRKIQKRYYIDISSKKLYEISKDKAVKCLFNRIDDSIIIVRSSDISARKLTPHSKKRIQIAIPEKLLKEKEIENLAKKGWLPISIKFDLNSFELEIKDFYSIKEEKELVGYLTNRGVMIKIKEPSDPYDILIKEKYIAIEVHNSIPKYGDLVTRHKIRPAMVRLRILEADFLTMNKELNKFYLIINKGWENGRYIKELIDKVNGKAKVLFTNFEDRWEKKIGEEIIKEIK